jgi:hypothetical protein
MLLRGPCIPTVTNTPIGSHEAQLKSRGGRRETEGRFGWQWQHLACQNRSNIFLTWPPLQGQLAERMGRSQQRISDGEQGQHRASVVEFFVFAEALGFDPRSAIRPIAPVKD